MTVFRYYIEFNLRQLKSNTGFEKKSANIQKQCRLKIKVSDGIIILIRIPVPLLVDKRAFNQKVAAHADFG